MTVRTGKLGIIRLKGRHMEALRRAAFEREKGHCAQCGVWIDWEGFHAGELAHIRTKRNNGDTLENVRMLCKTCHRDEHNPKSVPAKERV